MSDMFRRLGRVLVQTFLVEEQPEDIAKAMTGTVVLRCEHRYDMNAFEYILIHPDFDVVPVGGMPNDYVIIIHQNGDERSFEWKRKDVWS